MRLLATVFLCLFASRVQQQASATCTYGQLRLSNGLTATEGRLEICISNVWGTVCDDGFTTANARVVCRQLGYSTSGATYRSSAYFGSGTGRIWLDDVYCTGSESTLLQCHYNSIGSHNCVHSEDVSVICSSLTSTRCTYGQLRLSNGGTSSQGRLEICINNVWGTVCDDGFTNTNARVVCRQLGYSTSNDTYRSNAYFGSGTGYIWLDNVQCTGSESTLLQCSHNSIGFHNCGHSEDVSVICSNPRSPDTGSTAAGGATGGTVAFVVILVCCCCCICFAAASGRKDEGNTRTTRVRVRPATPIHTEQQHIVFVGTLSPPPPYSEVDPNYHRQATFTLPNSAV